MLLGLNGGTELPFILSLYGGEDATVIASLVGFKECCPSIGHPPSFALTKLLSFDLPPTTIVS